MTGDEANWFASSGWQEKNRNHVLREEEERKWWGRRARQTGATHCVSTGDHTPKGSGQAGKGLAPRERGEASYSFLLVFLFKFC